MNERADGRLARGQASRTAILTASTSVVAALGLSALTHRSVAAKAGVSHALVTYHFASAADLSKATLLHAGSRLKECLSCLLESDLDPLSVPRMASDLAAHMVTDLRDETATLFELLVTCVRDPELRPTLSAILSGITDLVEPLCGDRGIASTAAESLIGAIASLMAQGQDQNLTALREHVAHLIDRFDPRRP